MGSQSARQAELGIDSKRQVGTESHKRSIIKAMSWRIIAVVVTTLTTYFFTEEIGLSLGVGLVDSAIKIFAYYGHERWWNRVDFGMK
jgi:adenylylsulfate kinase